MRLERLKMILRGAVQGVGFRPFVYRLAREIGLNGWVLNSTDGVCLEVEGARPVLNSFIQRLDQEKPIHAVILSMESSFLDPVGFQRFEIRYSEDGGAKTALILPDLSTCAECVREIFDPHNRRYLYPFTNCTHCGPRFSIIEALPYDRRNTSMKAFTMCAACQAEYEDPCDRRFHAQPNACAACGPQLALWRANCDCSEHSLVAERTEAISVAADAIRAGEIIALKGVGGFQLIADARNEDGVSRLRKRKRREEKPFALMFPSLDSIRAHCHVTDEEARLLQSPEAPIVLLEQNFDCSKLAGSIAPRNPFLGALLPYSPLHHILMHELGFPIIATSGNTGGEPICITQEEAASRLAGIADLFLVHNRPIVRQMDDSIARVIAGRPQILRRARGYAPLPIQLQMEVDRGRNSGDWMDAETHPQILAVGPHLKNTVALNVGQNIFVSQHIGDLESQPACEAFEKIAADLPSLYEAAPTLVACDFHPDYVSTAFAERFVAEHASSKLVRVQHHYAHVLACAAENEVKPPFLGIAWDGTGWGLDGNIWGGEFLLVDETSLSRLTHFREFPLPGGEEAIKQPSRAALGLLWNMFGEKLFSMRELPPLLRFSDREISMLCNMLAREVHSPLTSSAGRLFDAVASILGICHRSTFEGQAAMELGFAARRTPTNDCYAFRLENGIVNWHPAIEALLSDFREGIASDLIAAKFHNGLAEAAVAVALELDLPRIVLSGGCFQNKLLAERTIGRLQSEGFSVYWHQRIPPNDGGVAVGQVMAALRQFRAESHKPNPLPSFTTVHPNNAAPYERPVCV